MLHLPTRKNISSDCTGGSHDAAFVFNKMVRSNKNAAKRLPHKAQGWPRFLRPTLGAETPTLGFMT
jgi:hypothetical protein